MFHIPVILLPISWYIYSIVTDIITIQNCFLSKKFLLAKNHWLRANICSKCWREMKIKCICCAMKSWWMLRDRWTTASLIARVIQATPDIRHGHWRGVSQGMSSEKPSAYNRKLFQKTLKGMQKVCCQQYYYKSEISQIYKILQKNFNHLLSMPNSIFWLKE